jgi:hypothetical protein
MVCQLLQATRWMTVRRLIAAAAHLLVLIGAAVCANAQTFRDIPIAPGVDLDAWSPIARVEKQGFDKLSEQSKKNAIECKSDVCARIVKEIRGDRSILYECSTTRIGAVYGPPESCVPRFQETAGRVFKAAPPQLWENAFGGREAFGVEIESLPQKRDPEVIGEVETILHSEPFSLSVQRSFDGSSIVGISPERKPLLLSKFRLEWITLRISFNRPELIDGQRTNLLLSVSDTIMVADYNVTDERAFYAPRSASDLVTKLLRDKIMERLGTLCGQKGRSGELVIRVAC